MSSEVGYTIILILHKKYWPCKTVTQMNHPNCHVLWGCEVTIFSTCDVTISRTCDVTFFRTYDVTISWICDVTISWICNITNSGTWGVTISLICDLTISCTCNVTISGNVHCRISFCSKELKICLTGPHTGWFKLNFTHYCVISQKLKDLTIIDVWT